MSIINDALKKVARDTQARVPAAQDGGGERPSAPEQPVYPRTEPRVTTLQPKRHVMITITAVVLSAVVGVVAAYTAKTVAWKRQPAGASSAVSENGRAIPALSASAPVTSPVASASPGGADTPLLDLNGIVYDEQKPYAVINNKILKEGENIAGATVIKISPEEVQLILKDKKIELRPKQ